MNSKRTELQAQTQEASKQYMQDLQNELGTDNRVNPAYQAWLRRLSGFKNVEDIKNENIQAYLSFAFLCDHNLYFNFLVHNRPDLIRIYFEKEAELKNSTDALDDDKPKTKQAVKIIQTALGISPQAEIKPVYPDKEKEFESYAREQEIQLNQLFAWQAIHHQILVERNQVLISNRVNLVQDINQFLSDIVSSPEVNNMLSDTVAALIADNAQRIEMIETIKNNPADSTEGLNDQLQDVRNITDDMVDFVKRILEEHPELAKHKDQFEDLVQSHQEDYQQKEADFNAKAEIAKAKEDMLLQDNIASKKELIEKSIEAIATIQSSWGDMTEDQQQALLNTQTNLMQLAESISHVDTTDEFKQVLTNFNQELQTFRAAFSDEGKAPLMQEIDRIQASAERLDEIQKKPVIDNVRAQSIIDNLNNTIQPQKTATSQSDFKARLEEVRENSKPEEQKKVEKLMKLYNEAKEDKNEPLEISEENDARVSELFQALHEGSMNGGIDPSQVEELQDQLENLLELGFENQALIDADEEASLLMGLVCENRPNQNLN